ncbi:glycosyltransferase family 4 protein [Patescibacteria group bacterium]|nr:glycosyltransferase family 4 protein [Patescibacteria group bacterium]MBU4511803.1 glycosyltransferase family 4 protein [Patescibacteria group bacterium]
MKICICTNTRPHEGGLVVYMNVLSLGLKDLGHDVDIISAFGIKKMATTKNNFVTTITRFLKKSSLLTIIAYQLNKSLLLFNIYKAFISKRYDIVHAMDFSAANVSYPLTRLLKKPLILSAHGFIESSEYLSRDKTLKKYFLKKIIKAYGRATLITSTAKYIDDDLISKNINPKKIVRINNFIDTSVFRPNLELKKINREKLSINKEDFVVLCVSRMTERKGVIYPLLALLKIIKGNPSTPLKLVYVGDGSQKEILENKIKENNLEKKVLFLGSIAHKKLPEIYNLADILVIPSITYQGKGEPQGITPLEAMASGLPAVAFATGGLPEIIKNGYNGFLVKEKDIADLAQVITKLIQDKNLKIGIESNALDYVTLHHSQKKIIPKIAKYYKSLIEKNEPT